MEELKHVCGRDDPLSDCPNCGIQPYLDAETFSRLVDEGQELRKTMQKKMRQSQFKMIPDPRTGAIKADGEKNRLDLWPVRPYEDVGWVLTYGARKYADRNWEKGFKWSRLFGSTLRHLFAWYRGETIDPESGLNHLAHAACNIIFLLEFSHTGAGEDDRPNH